MEKVVVLSNGKCRRKLSPEHPLFAPGTLLWATKYYQEPESMLQPEDLGDGIDRQDAAEAPFKCRLGRCDVVFRTVAGYEEHYDMVHRNVCRECSRSFLSLRLLDIHISETHDAFFKILSKKKPMYVCLVDGCPEMFQHDDKRTRHLVQVHHYPESFSFHQRRKPRKSVKDGKKKYVPAGSTPPDAGSDTPQGSGGGSNQTEDDKRLRKKREARKRRRQQKKKKFAGQVGGSDTTMQIDVEVDSEAGDKPEQKETSDVEMMDELEAKMDALKIPKSVTFGRKQRA